MDCVLHVSPDLMQATIVRTRANVSAVGIALSTGRTNDAVIHDIQNFADGNFGRRALQQIATINAPPAGDDAAPAEFEENLFEIFDRNLATRCDLMDCDDFRIGQCEVKHCPGRVLAFCRYSHRSRV
ncbi:MAG: hypothetical protein NVS9B14_20490 [Candidatus Acidiferrum sp.]